MKKLLAIVLSMVLLICSMPLMQANAVFYNGMFEDQLYSVSLSAEKPIEYRAFYPEKSGYYAFYSECYDYSDPFVYCYDENHNQLGYDDNNGGNENFCYIAYLEKDKAYNFEIGAKRFSSGKAIFNVTIIDLDKRIADINLGYTVSVTPSTKRGVEYFRFTPQDSGYYAFSSLQKYAFSNAVLYDSEFNLLDEDDDSGVGSSFYLSHYLEGGKTYYYMSTTSHNISSNTYEVTLNKCEIISQINIVSYPDKMTYYDGYVEQTVDLNGLSAQFVYTDGSTVEWTYSDDGSYSNELVGTTVYADITKDENGKYYGYVSADEGYASFDIEVVDCPVESIEVVSHTKVECYENMTGNEYFDSEKNERWFVYDYKLPHDLVMRINYDDGTYEETRFFDDNNEVPFKYSDNQLKGEKWSLGKNPVTLTYFDKECTFYVDVIENPIESLTLLKAPDRIYHFVINANDEDSEYCEINPYDISGIEIQVNYKDGTSKILNDEDWEYYSGELDGYRYYTDNYALDKPQEIVVKLRYCGHKVFYTVPVVEKGDVNLDYKISIADATEIQRIIVQLSSETDFYVTDYDNDGYITIMDATEIQRRLAKM